MSPESWGFIGALIGTVVGASASIITTVINSRNAAKIQKEIIENAQDEQFKKIQRENLLELQELVSHVCRLITKAHLEDLKNNKEGIKWSSARISPKLDNDIEVSIRELSIKLERIADDELREELLLFKKKVKENIAAVGYQEGEKKFMNLIEVFNNIMPIIGKVLRANF